MTDKSAFINDQQDEFNRLIDSFCLLMTDQNLFPPPQKLLFQEVNDGLLATVQDMSSELVRLFSEAGKKQKSGFHLQEIPITKSLDSSPTPLILLSDDSEIDSETSKLIQRRRENGYATFPLIIFRNSFFQLVEGENCSYLPVIERFENCTGETVMTFRENDFCLLPQYIDFVFNLFRIDIIVKVAEELKEKLKDDLTSGCNKLNNCDNISGLTIICKLKAIQNYLKELDNEQQKLEKWISVWKSEIQKLRDITDRKILEQITHIKSQDLSSFALNIELKYRKMIENIQAFLTKVVPQDYGVFAEDLQVQCENTKNEVEVNAAQLAIIGTFSSGKTTLINSFLGKRKVPLRTSAAHNTAVLSRLFYQPNVQERAEIIYKKELVWSVVKPAAMDKTAVNEEDTTITIVSVKQVLGNLHITYRKFREQRDITKTIRLPRSSAQYVKTGDRLRPGEPFVVANQMLSTRVEICSKQEIELLIQLVKQKNTDFRIKEEGYLENPNGPKQIIIMLNLIKEIASEKEHNTILYTELLDALRIPYRDKGPRAVAALPSKFRWLTVRCSLSLDTKTIMLDEKGWIRLCGDPDDKTHQSIALSEQPECYMLAKELRLYVHSDFLQYCTLVDTPGFGSVTEEHDNTSQSFIRSNNGRLLVMISVNAKTIDAKYQDLINMINDIYSNDRKNDKHNVIFILNCFRGRASESNLKTMVDKVSQMLQGYHFEKNNIYVCDLKSALTNGLNQEEMMEYPSYARFHDYITNQMISYDLSHRFKRIHEDWQDFFKRIKRQISEQIATLKNALKDTESSKMTIQGQIRQLDSIDIEALDYTELIIEKFVEWYKLLISAYTEYAWRKAKREPNVDKSMETITADLEQMRTEIEEEIIDYYRGIISHICK